MLKKIEKKIEKKLEKKLKRNWKKKNWKNFFLRNFKFGDPNWKVINEVYFIFKSALAWSRIKWVELVFYVRHRVRPKEYGKLQLSIITSSGHTGFYSFFRLKQISSISRTNSNRTYRFKEELEISAFNKLCMLF